MFVGVPSAHDVVRHTQDGLDAAFDVVIRRGPGRNTDAHGGVSLPNGAAAPAGAFGLDGRHNLVGGPGIAE